MSRTTAIAAPLLGVLVLGLTCAAHAQYLYVGFNNSGNSQTQDFTTPGMASVSAAGTRVSGNYSFVDAGTATTQYIQLQTFNTSLLTVSGGTFQYLNAEDTSVINLIGSGFRESSDFHSSPSGDPYYTINGILRDSQSPFTADYYAPSTGTLEFNGSEAVPGADPVPEASTTISLGLLLLLGCAWIAVRRRRSNSSP